MLKQRWRQLNEFIDAKTLRERTMIFLMVAAILGALFHMTLIEPLLTKQARLTRQLQDQEARTAAMQTVAQVASTQRRVDPNAGNRARLAALTARLAEMDKELGDLGSQVVPPQQMPRLLQNLVAQNQGLQLASVKTIPASDLVSESAPVPAAGAASSIAAKVPIYKHGVEIQVIGGYHDLLRYMTQLENSPWRMYWNDAHLKVENFPLSRLTLKVYTLSFEKRWLSV
mgnify:CR=1 FL=1